MLPPFAVDPAAVILATFGLETDGAAAARTGSIASAAMAAIY
jgi:hypothetical protein